MASDLHADNPDHTEDLRRLKRIRGQLEGIERMIQERRYCPDIVNQIQAASSAPGSM
jgi:DNA-binding FrmR family transcriptional regulator